MNQITQEDIMRLTRNKPIDHTRGIRWAVRIAITIIWTIAGLCIVADIMGGCGK